MKLSAQFLAHDELEARPYFGHGTHPDVDKGERQRRLANHVLGTSSGWAKVYLVVKSLIADWPRHVLAVGAGMGIDDSLGRAIGDRLLVAVSERLGRAVRKGRRSWRARTATSRSTGSVSQVYAPALGRTDVGVGLGPIVADRSELIAAS